jgi:hypothetical protein
MDPTVLDNIKDEINSIRKQKIPYIWLSFKEIKDIIEELSDFCLYNDFEIYRMYEGQSIYKCDNCEKWQEKHDFNVIDPDDDAGHFDCEFCEERNIIDYDEMYEHIMYNRRKHISYRPTNDIYIFDNSDIYNFSDAPEYILSHYEIYELERDINNPSKLLHYNEMLVDYLCWEDELEITDIGECWRYIPLVVYQGLI